MGELRDHPDPPDDDARPDPRVQVRHVTDAHPFAIPSAPRPSRDRPPRAVEPGAADGPAHRPPGLIPPRGEDLAKMDAPGAGRGDRFRKVALDQETLDTATDLVGKWTHVATDVFPEKPTVPPTARTETRTRQTISASPHLGLDTGDTLTAMFVTGILIGEGVRWTYRRASELKETWHGRNG